MNTNSKRNSLKYKKIANYTIFIVIITVLSWFNILLFFFMKDPEARGVLFWANGVLTFILLLDVLIRWHWAKSAKKYFVDEYGWLDFIGSFPVFSLARAPNVVRTIRVLRGMGSNHVLRSFISNRGESAVLTITLAVILLFEFASIFILWAEGPAPDANIVTANDAMWWVLVTVATVGYGDKYPVTGNGRFIATFVIIAGVGLFGILSGFMAQLFLGKNDDDTDSPEDTAVSLDDLMVEIKQLRQEYGDSSRRLAALEDHLMGSRKGE
ncbi:MAG: ion transporter [Chloroflexi bacterium]|nr:ion transporter [Chloroflexota bacterium]